MEDDNKSIFFLVFLFSPFAYYFPFIFRIPLGIASQERPDNFRWGATLIG